MHTAIVLKMALDNGPHMKQPSRKATLMIRQHAFGPGTTMSFLGSPDHSRAARCGREKENAREKVKADRKERQERLNTRQRRLEEEWLSPLPVS